MQLQGKDIDVWWSIVGAGGGVMVLNHCYKRSDTFYLEVAPKHPILESELACCHFDQQINAEVIPYTFGTRS